MARDIGGNKEYMSGKKEKWCSGSEGQERVSNFLELTELMNC